MKEVVLKISIVSLRGNRISQEAFVFYVMAEFFRF
jgi:hypothetical protein